jgi:pimeloyl-ACP methyl ester carboxylesterase
MAARGADPPQRVRLVETPLRAGCPGAFSEQDVARYIEAWSQPGAITSMVNYYRAALRQTPRKALERMSRIDAETLVIWGEHDRYLGAELAQPPPEWVPNAQVTRIPDASHWVQHDSSERVNELLIRFLR